MNTPFSPYDTATHRQVLKAMQEAGNYSWVVMAAEKLVFGQALNTLFPLQDGGQAFATFASYFQTLPAAHRGNQHQETAHLIGSAYGLQAQQYFVRLGQLAHKAGHSPQPLSQAEAQHAVWLAEEVLAAL